MLEKIKNAKLVLSLLVSVAAIFGITVTSFTEFYTTHFITVIPVLLVLTAFGIIVFICHLHQDTNDKFRETENTHSKIINALNDISQQQMIDRIERMYRQNGNGKLKEEERLWSEAESRQYDALAREFNKSGLNSYNQARMDYLSTFKVRD